jgi:predicted transcriptional regulator of viral defense system
MLPPTEEKILELAQTAGLLRSRDLQEHDIPRTYLQRLCARGLLRRTGRGLYVLANAEPTEKQSLIEACRRVPQGVVCLLSALQFHELTTQSPAEVWLAVGNRWRPRAEYPPLRVVYFSGKAWTVGWVEHVLQGGTVKVYSPAKTVADCFKYRHKLGLDVALETLRDCWRQRRATMDELWKMARVCRMTNVMRPYLESLV